MEELVRRHATIMDVYDPEKRIAMVVDEWGTWFDVEPGTNPGFLFQQNTMRDALVAALTLNIFHAHADRVRVANLAQTVNVLQAPILTDGPQMIRTPTYHVFDLYAPHQDAAALPVFVEGSDYQYDGRGLPRVHATASRADDGAVTCSVCNLDYREQAELVFDLRGASVREATGRLLAAPSPSAHNSGEAPDTVSPQRLSGLRVNGASVQFVLPPASVATLRVRTA
jgi:alpha-N-arabinofuranosidase